MQNLTDLFNTCNLFEKIAQNTVLDKKLEKIEPLVERHNEPPSEFYGYYPGNKRKEDSSNFTQLELNPVSYEPYVDPYTGKSTYRKPKYPEWTEIDRIEEEKQKLNPPKQVEKEDEENEELSQEHKLKVPDIEPYHFIEQEVPKEYLQDDKPTKQLWDQEFLEEYKKLQNDLSLLRVAYKEANERAENKPAIIDDIENFPLIEVVRHLADYAIALMKYKSGKLLGIYMPKEGALAKYLGGNFNPFMDFSQISSGNKYDFYFKLKKRLNDIKQARVEAKSILDEYSRVKRLEVHTFKYLYPKINEYLSHPETISLLEWTDKNNPDGKKQVITEFKKYLFERTQNYNSKYNQLSHFSINEMFSIKSFKSLYEKLGSTLTENVSSKLMGAGEQHIENIVHKAISEELQIYIKELQDDAILKIPKENIDIKELQNIFIPFKKKIQDIFNIDFGSIEQYIKINYTKKAISNVPGLENDDVIRAFYIILFYNFTVFFDRLEGKSSNHFNFIRDIRNILFQKVLKSEPVKYIGKDISQIVSHKDISNETFQYLKQQIIEIIPGIHRQETGKAVGFFDSYQIVRNDLNDWKNADKRLYEYNSRAQSLFATNEISDLISMTGGVGVRNSIELLKTNFPELPEQILNTLVKYIYRENKLNLIKDITSSSYGFKLLLKVLSKFNKLSFDNIINNFDLIDDLDIIFRVFTTDLNKDTFTPEISSNIIIDAIRALNTAGNDIKNLKFIVSLIHNSGANLPASVALGLFKNPNTPMIEKVGIIKKIYDAVVKISNMGGEKKIKQDYGTIIKEMVKSKLVSRSIFTNIKFLMDLFISGTKINPSLPNFKDVFRITSEIETDLNAITLADAYKEMYQDYEPKDPNLFKLDMKINNRLRFRVLKDKDPRHLRIGIETNCCQRIGGVGETAARDSFVNPTAGVLILEWLNNENQWTLLTQSYFHYIPKENGYILDNIESNISNINDSNVDIEEAYGWYAAKLQKKIKFNYFLAGKGYSDLNASKFGSDKKENDPRYFSPKALTEKNTDHYSDYEERNSIDLTKPLFDIKKLNPNWGLPKLNEEMPGIKEAFNKFNQAIITLSMI